MLCHRIVTIFTDMSTRDKDATKRKILQALGDLICDGFDEVGVNRIAERAGVDKVLIYRYFGGLPGLLAAFAHEGDAWPEFEEIMETAPYVAAMLPPEEAGARFVHGFIRELQSRPATQEILRWELVKENDLTRETAAVREQRLGEVLECYHGSEEDPAAMHALLAAGILHLILHAKTSEQFCGIPLRTPEGWARIERVATKMLAP